MVGVCQRHQDGWGFQILGCLKTCGDLVAAEAHYHINSYSYFPSFKPITILDSKTNLNLGGRPVDRTMAKFFDRVCTWMEDGDNKLYTIAELHDKMKQLSLTVKALTQPVILKLSC